VKMKILFTGHRGFLGRELIPKLVIDYEVVKFNGDLRNFDELSKFVSLNRIDSVIHAAVRGGRRLKADDYSVLEVNLLVGVNVFRLGLPLVSFCSGAVYGRQRSIFNVREWEAGLHFPTDFYGQSKFLFRQLVKASPEVTLLRFFSVFGILESPERFLRSNISCYWNREAMKVFQDSYADFFFVQDTLLILQQWLNGNTLPKEINLVYQEKYLLSEICKKINDLGTHKVNIEVDAQGRGNDYCGDGSVLASMDVALKGLDYGLEKMFSHYRIKKS